jgi:hypothetical protein
MTGDGERPRRVGTAAIALTTAVVALVSSGIGLVFDLFPDLRPDPRTTRAATLRVATMERGVTVGDWLQRISSSPKDLRRRRDEVLRGVGLKAGDPLSRAARDQLKAPGSVFFVDTTIQGLKRSSVTLRWSVYDARTRGRTTRRNLHDVPALGIRLETPADRSVVQVWTPYVTRRGPWFLRFELRTGDGTSLAVADSRRFHGL